MGNQESRNNVLLDEEDPLIELQLIEYCVLERIGRSRKTGEITQGHFSINSAFKIDAGSSFHYQKALIQNRYIKKQKFFLKMAISEQYRTGNLVLLTRFYRRVKSMQLLIAERIVNTLRSKPNFRMPMTELRTMFPFFEPTMKVLKNPEFRKFIKADVVSSVCYFYLAFGKEFDDLMGFVNCWHLVGTGFKNVFRYYMH